MASYINSVIANTQKLVRRFRKHFSAKDKTIENVNRLDNLSRDIRTSAQSLIDINMLLVQKQVDYDRTKNDLDAAEYGSYSRKALSQTCSQMLDELSSVHDRYEFQFTGILDISRDVCDVSSSILHELSRIFNSMSRVPAPSDSRKLPILRNILETIARDLDTVRGLDINMRGINNANDLQPLAIGVSELAQTISDAASNGLGTVYDEYDIALSAQEIIRQTTESLARTTSAMQEINDLQESMRRQTEDFDARDVQPINVAMIFEGFKDRLKPRVNLLKTMVAENMALLRKCREKETNLKVLDRGLSDVVGRVVEEAHDTIGDANAAIENCELYITYLNEQVENITVENIGEGRQRRLRLHMKFKSYNLKILKSSTKSPKLAFKSPKTKVKKSKSPKLAFKSPKTKVKKSKSPKLAFKSPKTKVKKSPKLAFKSPKTKVKKSKSPKLAFKSPKTKVKKSPKTKKTSKV
jgi:hypothetical protein